MSKNPDHLPRRSDDEPPPFLGEWRNVYVFVICYLACVIAAFYAFTLAYAP